MSRCRAVCQVGGRPGSRRGRPTLGHVRRRRGRRGRPEPAASWPVVPARRAARPARGGDAPARPADAHAGPAWRRPPRHRHPAVRRRRRLHDGAARVPRPARLPRAPVGAPGDPRPAPPVDGRRQAPRRAGRRRRRPGQPDRPQPRRHLRTRGRPGRAVARATGDHGRQPVRRRPQGERRVADVRVGHRHPHQEHPARGAWPGSTSRSRCRRRRSTAARTASSPGARASTPTPRWPRTSRCPAATSGCCTTRPCST